MQSGKRLSDEDLLAGYVEAESQYEGYELTLESLDAHQVTAEIEAAKTQEVNEFAHQREINDILANHGMTDRIDIKRGITATVAVFLFHGNNPKIAALERCGYVMVKIPPLASSNNKHAQETYQNEFEIIEEIGHINRKTRPQLLAVRLGGINFIFNSPVFFNEELFCKERDIILNHRQQLPADAASTLESKYEFEEFVRRNFFNLSSYIQEFATSGEDPERIFDIFFCSMLGAMYDLHDDGVLHLDFSGKNLVARYDGATLLVDLGMAAMMFKVNNRSRTNRRFAMTSLMHNSDALQAENYTLDVITDYISLQKTMLELIAVFVGVDFYTMCIQGLNEDGSLRKSKTEILAKHTDEQVINNAIFHIRAAALKKIEKGILRGEHGLKILDKYIRYFTHIHNRKHSYQELRAANNERFYECTSHMLTAASSEMVASVINHFDSIKQQQEEVVVKKEVPNVPEGAVSKAVKKFGLIAEAAKKDVHHVTRARKKF